MDIPVHPTLIKNDIVELEPLNPSVEKKNHLPKLHFWDSMLAFPRVNTVPMLLPVESMVSLDV